MKAYVLIKIHTGGVPEAVRQLRTVKGVVDVNATFGPYDAVALIQGDDVNRVGRIVTWDIQAIPGVTETLTCLIIEVT